MWKLILSSTWSKPLENMYFFLLRWGLGHLGLKARSRLILVLKVLMRAVWDSALKSTVPWAWPCMRETSKIFHPHLSIHPAISGLLCSPLLRPRAQVKAPASIDLFHWRKKPPVCPPMCARAWWMRLLWPESDALPVTLTTCPALLPCQ